MADYYTDFSEEIRDLTQEEAAWLNRLVSKFQNMYEDDYQIHWKLDSNRNEAWFYSYGYECSDIEKTAEIIQRFLRRWRPDQIFTLSYADTCSKPRIGSFSGGGFVVTAEKIYYNHIWNWIEKTKDLILAGEDVDAWDD